MGSGGSGAAPVEAKKEAPAPKAAEKKVEEKKPAEDDEVDMGGMDDLFGGM